MTLTQADERIITFTPPGYRYTLAFAAYVKRVLTQFSISTGERLKLLEGMETLIDGFFTEEVFAAVQPAGEIDAQMITEALSVDRGNPPTRPTRASTCWPARRCSPTWCGSIHPSSPRSSSRPAWRGRRPSTGFSLRVSHDSRSG